MVRLRKGERMALPVIDNIYKRETILKYSLNPGG